jgi:hypothetical protein
MAALVVLGPPLANRSRRFGKDRGQYPSDSLLREPGRYPRPWVKAVASMVLGVAPAFAALPCGGMVRSQAPSLSILTAGLIWRPQRDSNPCLQRERLVSLTPRRWGRGRCDGGRGSRFYRGRQARLKTPRRRMCGGRREPAPQRSERRKSPGSACARWPRRSPRNPSPSS